MTCEDFRAILDRPKTPTTTAERCAVVRHCRECPPCYEMLQQRAAVEEAKMTPEQLEEVERRVAATFAKDLQDPEASR